MNKLTIIGNLTRDPESHTTSSGKFVCNFSVAVDRKKKIEGQPEVDYFRVAAWSKLGELCDKYLAKGRKVCVIGPVSVNTYAAQDGTTRASMEVYAEEVEFISPGKSSTQAPDETAPAEGQTLVAGGFTAVDADELPF